MQLKPGLRFQSAVCDTQVVVVRGGGEIDLRCGGMAMAPLGDEVERQPLDQTHAEGTLMGKRYGDEESGLEVLCTKPGAGGLAIGDVPLPMKEAKPLPSSD